MKKIAILLMLTSCVAFGKSSKELQFVYYENAVSRPTKFHLKEMETDNGFCHGGTGFKRVHKGGNEFIQIKCFNVNLEGRPETLTMIRSSLGYHIRSCVHFKNTNRTHTFTYPLAFLASSIFNVNESLDTKGKEFAKIRDMDCPFVYKCKEQDRDWIEPVATPIP